MARQIGYQKPTVRVSRDIRREADARKRGRTIEPGGAVPAGTGEREDAPRLRLRDRRTTGHQPRRQHARGEPTPSASPKVPCLARHLVGPAEDHIHQRGC
jgi:hypothetical protein